MTQDTALDRYIAAASEALGLDVAPQWHAEIKMNLQVTLRLAGVVAAFPLPDDAEPAPVFRA